MLNCDGQDKLVEVRLSKKIGSKNPWGLGDLWQPVFDRYLQRVENSVPEQEVVKSIRDPFEFENTGVRELMHFLKPRSKTTPK